MRGGALVVLAWAALLGALFVGHWIYAAEPTQIAISGGSIGVMLLWGLVAVAVRRESLRRGPPPPRRIVEAIPAYSFAAGLIGFSVASIAFGFVWGRFLTYFGAGLLLISLVRLAAELRSERRTLAAHVPPRAGEARLGDPAAASAPAEIDRHEERTGA